MIEFNKIESWYELTDFYRGKKGFKCEMSREQHGILCGLLRDIKPKKILEIGVAEGGTTSVIMRCLSEMQLNSEVYSVDISEILYYNKLLKTGYIYDEMNNDLKYSANHTFLLGDTIASYIEKIGAGIDFVILDAMHTLPGEILDFLTVFPFCTSDAVFVIHDVNLNYYSALSDEISRIRFSSENIATKLLFASIVADKYMNNVNDNIAVIRLNKDSRRYIDNIFYALTMNWSYMPTQNNLNEYMEIIRKYYAAKEMEILEKALQQNRVLMERQSCLLNYMFPYEKVKNKRVVLYGAGKVGKELYSYFTITQYCKIVGWLDKNFKDYDNKKYVVESPKELVNKEYDYILISVLNYEVYEEIRQDILKIGNVDNEKIIGPLEYMW